MSYGTFEKYAITSIFLKILLFPAYRSTDFEVHRNWMAITYSFPISKWYYDNTSEWTIDYPPFFPWMEYVFSLFARWIDPEMLKVTNFNYANNKTIYFQRSTVIITDLVLIYSLRRYIQLTHYSEKKLSKIVAISIIFSPGLFIVDHIHFQYNGFLYGLLLLSICYAKNSDKILRSSVIFLILLCFKHLYLYLAPAYFIYVIRVYCLSPNLKGINVKNIIKLMVSVFLVIMLAFGPFLYYNQLNQIKSRLFPFSRGLTHAYWAPNIWALYSFIDRVLIALAPHFNIVVRQEAINSLTRGLIGDVVFGILPNITPMTTFIITCFFQMIYLIKLFINPTYNVFLGAIVLCGFSSFIFGWHVHEKAILMVIIPFSLLSLKDRRYFTAFCPLAIAGYISFFPLIFTPLGHLFLFINILLI